MSLNAFDWAMRQNLPCQLKMILMMLSDGHCDDSDECLTIHDRLAQSCGLPLDKMMDSIKILIAAGYLSVLDDEEIDGRIFSSYQLHLDIGVPESYAEHLQLLAHPEVGCASGDKP